MKLPICVATMTLAALSCPAQDGVVPTQPLVIGAGKPVDALANEPHLKNVRQLTFDGENAEAYWSNDGKKLVLQRRSADMPADQIYVLDLASGDLKLVSTGKGRTTCSYFMQGDDQIIFASTHHHGEAPPVVKMTGRGYQWAIHQEYDLFLVKPDGSQLTQLTKGTGYDAEATVCPVTGAIVFTSTRDGDPELYLINTDGTGLKRLTDARGYDGGAFFSPDGKRLVYRANHPEGAEELATYDEIIKDHLVRPTRLELFVMDVDGKNQRQVTSNGKANFAPFFHPDGKRIIFSSNQADPKGRDFDLFLIADDGTGQEQVTFNDSFDGFPMFTRDGKTLVFASNRGAATPGDTNVFLATWVD